MSVIIEMLYIDNKQGFKKMPEEFRQTSTEFVKDVCQVAQQAELLETRLNNTITTENARKARQRQANKVFKTHSILYTKDARHMI